MTLTPSFDLSFGHAFGTSAVVPAELLSAAVERRKPRSTLVCRPPAIADAMAQWTDRLGADYVRFDADTQDRYARCTLPNGTRPVAVLNPGNTDDVRAIVDIASRAQLPIHPHYCGTNWGFGDACAPADGWAIIDLGRMDKIIEVNEELCYAVIEPGVTQGQLYNYLQQHHPQLMLDVTADGPDASVIGCTLQRGFGYTPYGNRFAHLSGLEVVLADGRAIQTGFGSLGEKAKAQFVFPWGQGPALDGVFTQSHLGIVTRMGIWLMPEPESVEAFYCSVPREDDFSALVDLIRELRLKRIVQGSIELVNDLRVISTQRSFPYELCQSGNPSPLLPPNIRSQLRAEHDAGAWNVYGGLYGSKESVRLSKRTIRDALATFGEVEFLTKRKLSIAKRLAGVSRAVGFGERLTRNLTSAELVHDLINGVPRREHIRGLGWRNPITAQGRIEPGETGLITIDPVVPATPYLCRLVIGTVGRVMSEFGFDPMISVSSVTERSMIFHIDIHFDVASHQERLKAKECGRTLTTKLVEQGLYCCRRRR